MDFTNDVIAICALALLCPAGLFIGAWLGVCAVNFLIGVFGAGYSVATELGVHAIVFGVPAGLAWFLSHRAASGRPDSRMI